MQNFKKISQTVIEKKVFTPFYFLQVTNELYQELYQAVEFKPKLYEIYRVVLSYGVSLVEIGRVVPEI